MERKHLLFSTYLAEALKDPAFKEAYDKLEPEYAAIEAVLKARKEKGLTQAKLAKKMGSKQAVISRLEAGLTNPSVSFLKRLADALDCRLEIRFKPC